MGEWSFWTNYNIQDRAFQLNKSICFQAWTAFGSGRRTIIPKIKSHLTGSEESSMFDIFALRCWTARGFKFSRWWGDFRESQVGDNQSVCRPSAKQGAFEADQLEKACHSPGRAACCLPAGDAGPNSRCLHSSKIWLSNVTFANLMNSPQASHLSQPRWAWVAPRFFDQRSLWSYWSAQTWLSSF